MAAGASVTWCDKLSQAEKTSFLHDGKRKIHYKFTDGQEMAEEYDLKTDALRGRKWRKKTTLGRIGRWQIEVGEPIYSEEQLETDGLRENVKNPAFYRLDTQTAFQWKVRNTSPPWHNYEVSVDAKSREIIIRTLNKTYYKKFSIPDLDRLNLMYNSDKLSVDHQLNTLIITYEKPSEVLRLEAMLLEQLKKLKSHKETDDC